MQIVNAFNTSFLSPLLTPLQSLAAWLAPVRATTQPLVPPANAPLAYQRLTLPFPLAGSTPRRHMVRPASSFRVTLSSAQANSVCRLRIVREHDATGGPACAGRMVISGRMADVCAELDRMAQREAAAR